MANVHLAYESGRAQHAQSVIDRIQREHRVRGRDLGKQIFSRWMSRTVNENVVDGRPLRRRFQAVFTKFVLNVFKGKFHWLIASIPY